MDALAGIDEHHAGLDAIVHLGAIPAPGRLSDVATFHNNMLSTFNVLNAARKLGITRIVTASSETVLGLPFDTPPPYIPVDEEYPARPESTYSLVKHLEEQLAIQLVRWDPELSISALRFSNVMDPERLCRVPVVRRRPDAAQMEPLGLHRRPRRRPGRGARARDEPAGLRGLHHRGGRHRHVARRTPNWSPRCSPACR